ncbi:MAG TPA: DUF3180 domain-containing protein [Leifsonia sp.]|nr:conserved rane protein [Microbacteriaceae bacterium]HEV7812878.1 DUF3180 domain-containing protein [Leifsonia sp.]
MKRTSATALLVLLAVGAAGAALVQVGLTAAGRPIVSPPITLPLALAAIGAIVVILALPIRRMTQAPPRDTVRAKRSSGPVDPFYATRVVMLAKASALSGALLTGAGAGMLGHLLTRSVAPGADSIGMAVAATVGAAILLVCGLVAEFMCRIPPEDDEDGDDGKPLRAIQ